MKIQYGFQHGRRHLHITNCSFKFDDRCAYPEVFGDNEYIQTTLDVNELLHHHKSHHFVTFNRSIISVTDGRTNGRLTIAIPRFALHASRGNIDRGSTGSGGSIDPHFLECCLTPYFFMHKSMVHLWRLSVNTVVVFLREMHQTSAWLYSTELSFISHLRLDSRIAEYQFKIQ